MKYDYYTVEEFVLDEEFQQWVLEPDKDPTLTQSWENWLVQCPQQGSVVEEARNFIHSVAYKTYELPEEDFQTMWQAVERETQKVEEEIPLKPVYGSRQTSHWRTWQKVAAAALLLIIPCVAFFLTQQYGTNQYQTEYGEIREVVLPDGSTVMLNANSQLTLASDWSAERPREVWLKGEAFFSVTHIASHQRFLVHTTDGNTVEVLGTQFNVSERRGRTKVVLSSGKVKLNLKNRQPVLLKPGELVEVKEKTSRYEKKVVNPAHFSSWTKHKLVFDGTPLSDVIFILEDTYGVSVEVADISLVEKKIWGEIPTDDIDTFLAGIAQSLDLDISISGNLVKIKQTKHDDLL